MNGQELILVEKWKEKKEKKSWMDQVWMDFGAECVNFIDFETFPPIFWYSAGNLGFCQNS